LSYKDGSFKTDESYSKGFYSSWSNSQIWSGIGWWGCMDEYHRRNILKKERDLHQEEVQWKKDKVERFRKEQELETKKPSSELP
jgi:hypothetical protein